MRNESLNIARNVTYLKIAYSCTIFDSLCDGVVLCCKCPSNISLIMDTKVNSTTVMVYALYSYKKNNDDELTFKKGDLIKVLQKEEVNGWWKGILNQEKGWFPSNYVKELTDQHNQYKKIILRDITDSEKAYVTELYNLVTNYLQPLQTSSVLTEGQYKQLTSNITDVLEVHQLLLNLLEAELNKSVKQQRFGNIFLQWSTQIRDAYQVYCSLHPRAVCILDIFRDDLTKFMESRGAACPGILVLTTKLSKPFRRLDKYCSMLLELQRYMESYHPDNEDTQKCVMIYKDIAAVCSAIRRQKELELQVLTGPICGWEGPNLTTLGDIVHMSLVALKSHYCYLLLFPSTLVILSVSHALSAFVYEGKIFLTSLTASRYDACKKYEHAFEISSPITAKTIVFCQNEREADHWVQLLNDMSASEERSSISEEQSQELQILNRRGYSSSLIPFPAHNSTPHYTPIYPPEDYPSAAPYAALTRYYHKLIKSKMITRKMLKQLLYSEYTSKMNQASVRIRHHKAEVCIYTKDEPCRSSIINCDKNSNRDSFVEADGAGKIVQRQNAIQIHSACSSHASDISIPYGYIRYYNPESDYETKQTMYESMVDLGPDMSSRQSANISFMSTLSINQLKQVSEESQVSSVISRPKPYKACENLCTLDDNIELSSLTVPQPYSPSNRQSCPTKFVANKFNQSSLTAIYIPPWSNSDNNIKYKNNSNETSVESSTHSSILELPVNTLPIPDRMLGELLYGEYAESASADSDHAHKSVIVGQNQDVKIHFDRMNLSLENVGFRKHSINSDKPWQIRDIQVDPRKLKRFNSSRCIQLSRPHDARDSFRKSCCRCGRQDYCHTMRSSDSGMEGSCNLNSSDIGKLNNSGLLQAHLSRTGGLEICEKISDIDTRNYESECRCTSPFDSTPRTSKQDSIPEFVLIGSRDSSTLSTSMVSSYYYTQPTDVQAVSRIGIKKSYSAGCILEKYTREDTNDQFDGAPMIYKSGLYAHWWMKTNLPAAVMKGIKMEMKSRSTKKN